MATEPQKKSLLSATDRPTERLLNRLSAHVVYNHLFSVASELQVTEAQFSQAKAAANGQPKYHVFRVLSCWENQTVELTVETVIDRVKEWRKKRYVVKEVWDSLQDLVDFELPADDTDDLSVVPESLPKGVLAQEKLEYIQKLTKQSLRTKPFCLAVSKDWTLRSSKTDLREIYTDLSWIRKHRKAYNIEQEDLKNITQILSEEQLGEDGPVRILVQGKGGIGKSMAMKHLAISWADGTVEELNKFHFLFHIALKHVKDNSPIENIIIAQHSGLKANKVKPAEIKSILEGDTDSKVLLLIDGHDEYKTGGNTDIDDAIKKESLWNCWVILTSRETEQLKEILEYMDAEAEIVGFDNTGVKQYIMKSVGSEEKMIQMLKQAIYSGLCEEHDYVNLAQDGADGTFIKDYGILTIPILVNMVIVLFLSSLSLPKTKGGIMQAIVDRCIDREAIRAKGQKAVDSAKQALFNLGKLAWQGLNEAGKKLIFEKEEVIRVAGKEALELGLLFGTERMSMQEEETDVLCFPHLLLQEFAAAKYVSELDKDELELLFPSWETIQRHEEVIKFACQLSPNPDVFIELIYDRLAKYITQNTSGPGNRDRLSALSDVERQPPEEATIDPLHNKYFSYVSHTDNWEFIQSRVYVSKSGANSRAILYETDTRTESPTSPGRYAVLAQGEDQLVCIRRLIQRVRIYQHVLISDINSSMIQVQDSDENSGALTAHTPSTILGNEQLVNTLKVVQEIQKHQPVFFSRLELHSVRNTVTTTSSYTPTQTSLPEKESFRAKRYSTFRRQKHDSSKSSWSPLSPRRRENVHGYRQHDRKPRTDTENSTIENLMLSSFRLSRHTTSVTLWYNELSAPVLKHIVIQLHGCDKLTTLQIGFTSGTPLELGKALKTMTSLKELQIGKSRMTSDVTRAVMSGLSHCCNLEELDFGVSFNKETAHVLEVVLTGSLYYLFGGKGFPALKSLVLRRTKVNRADVSSISQAAEEGKLPQLQELRLTDNILTDCFQELLTSSNGFVCLQKLAMGGTQPSRADLNHISEALQRGKLPELKEWSLSHNTLTDCLGDLLGGTHHPKFLSLVTLILWKAELSAADVSSLSQAVKRGQLPVLTDLDLSENRLSRVEEAVEELVETCVENTRDRRLVLFLWDNDLSEEFQQKIKSLCRDSCVCLEL